MSYGFCNFCSFGEDKSSTLTLINKDSEIPVGKDRIYKLSHNEELNDYTQSFCHSESNEINPPNKLLEKYNLNNSIFEMKMPYICIFCGGESCKWEDPSIRKNSAIHGLLADLYYDCVYACQRPSTCLIKNKGLEEDCGFSYSPSAFISEGIEVLCKGFKDLTPPDTLDFMLDVVRKMAYVVKYKKGRILVHCHAGNGRTGIVIVCFFMFYFNKTYQEALTELRKLRKKGVEKIPQEIYCQKFGSKRQKIHVFLKNQKILDYDFDKSFINSIVISYYLKDFNISNIKELSNKIVDINFIPKLIFECIEKIIEIKIFTNMSLKELYLILNGMNVLKENSLQAIKIIREELKVNNWDTFKIQNDIAIINELLFIWMNECVFNCIDPQKIEQIINDFILLIIPSQNNSTLPESKISNDKLNTIDNELLNKIQKLFEICIDNPKNQNMEILNKMINITKLSLSKLEYETIKYISIFLQIIYPTNKFNIDWTDLNNNINNNIDDSNIYEFKRFLYRFSLFLLGYNLDKINSTPNKFLKSKELLQAKMLIFIFELFIFHKNDSLFNLNEFTRNNEVLLENEDLFFKYKNSNELRSIKNFL